MVVHTALAPCLRNGAKDVLIPIPHFRSGDMGWTNTRQLHHARLLERGHLPMMPPVPTTTFGLSIFREDRLLPCHSGRSQLDSTVQTRQLMWDDADPPPRK